MSAGRPSEYTPEMVERICSELAQGVSLKRVCDAPDVVSVRTVFNWMNLHPEFVQRYEAAKAEAADLFAEEIVEIADDGRNDFMASQEDGGGAAYKYMGEHVQRSRLRVDARKWVAAKLKPKKYGDKLHTELTGADGGPLKTITTIEIKAVDP